MFPRPVLVPLVLLVLMAAACGADDDSADTSAGAPTEAPADPADPADASEPADPTEPPDDGRPVVAVPSGEAPTELVIEDLIEGDGVEATVGDMVSVHYVGVLFRNGEQFDASWDRGSPFDFTLGNRQVIAGWDEGVAGMKVGGRRQLVIPPELAYGEAGSPGGIGPNETLVFVVDLLDVSTPVTLEDVELPEEAPSELVVEDIFVGDGEVLEEGAVATVHYIGVSLSTGEVFDSSWDRGEPASFQVAEGALIAGWVEGMPGMQIGGRRRLVIPPELAYGEEGIDGVIEPGETLVFVVDLLGVS